jgi:hypothetical protein
LLQMSDHHPARSHHVHGIDVDIATENHIHILRSGSSSSPHPLRVLPGTATGRMQSRVNMSMRDDTFRA